jgi:hypothetical protein
LVNAGLGATESVAVTVAPDRLNDAIVDVGGVIPSNVLVREVFVVAKGVAERLSPLAHEPVVPVHVYMFRGELGFVV